MIQTFQINLMVYYPHLISNIFGDLTLSITNFQPQLTIKIFGFEYLIWIYWSIESLSKNSYTTNFLQAWYIFIIDFIDFQSDCKVVSWVPVSRWAFNIDFFHTFRDCKAIFFKGRFSHILWEPKIAFMFSECSTLPNFFNHYCWYWKFFTMEVL